MTFGGFKAGGGEIGKKGPTAADARDAWITPLDDRSFVVDFRGGEFANQRFRGYDVLLAEGRRRRHAAGSPDATHRIFVTKFAPRRITELSYPAAHQLTFLEVEQQLYDPRPIQGWNVRRRGSE